MPRSARIIFLAAVVILAAGAAVRSAAPQPPGGEPPRPSDRGRPPRDQGGPPGPRGMMGPRPAPVDSFVAERDSLMNLVLHNIAGRENAPAESVFKNIKVMKGVPAGRLLQIMNHGFGRNLGVSCSHCHVENHWADEDKAPKQITREMIALADTINDVLLPRIKNLQSQKPHVACATCHRGQVKPATSL